MKLKEKPHPNCATTMSFMGRMSKYPAKMNGMPPKRTTNAIFQPYAIATIIPPTKLTRTISMNPMFAPTNCWTCIGSRDNADVIAPGHLVQNTECLDGGCIENTYGEDDVLRAQMSLS